MLPSTFLPVALALLAPQGEDHDVAQRLFEQRFVHAVRSARQGVGPARAWEQLERAAEFIPELAPDRRPAAQLAVTVRQAELRLLQERELDAAELLTSARAAALEAEVWDGRYRELGLLLMWQVAPIEFSALPEVERTFLSAMEGEARRNAEEAATTGEQHGAEVRALSLGLIRLERKLDDADALVVWQAERELAAAAERLDALTRAAVRGAQSWRDRAIHLLAWHFVLRRDYDRAEAWLAKLPQDLTLYPRAIIALRNGDPAGALAKGRALAERDPRHEQLVGDASEALGDLTAAEAAYRRALDAGLEPGDRMVVHRGLGECALARWRAERTPDSLATARREFDRAAALAEQLGEQAGFGHVEVERFQLTVLLGRLAESEGRPADAFATFLAALDAFEVLRARTLGDPFGSAIWRLDRFDAVEGMLRTHAAGGASAFEMLAVLERAKARTLLDWTAAEIVRAPRQDLAAAVHALAVTTSAADVPRRLATLEERRLAAGAPRADGGVTAPLGVDEVTRLVRAAPEVAVLSYWLGREACWVVWARGAESGVERLGTRAEAVVCLGAARRAVAAPGDLQTATEALTAGSQWFLPVSVAAALRGARRVVFCPDDDLGLLPFEALPRSTDGLPWGVAVGVERAPSLSVRARLGARSAQADHAGVVVVHSVADSAGVGAAFELDPLQTSAREAELVRSAAGQTVELAGDEASVARLGAVLRAGAFEAVHVSAHAVIDPRVPTSSLLVLADGAASVDALSDLPLRGALLVLSACSTARGERRGGGGEVGLLGWACAAGARGAVASMWDVNQQATTDLMGQFWAERAAGADEAEAMRRARGTLRDAEQYAHPFYWAGFGVFAPAQREATVARRGTDALYVLAIGALLVGIGLWMRSNRTSSASET